MEKLSYPELFKILLSRGYIVERCPSNGKRRVYKVYSTKFFVGKNLYITPKMFEDLCNQNLLISTGESRLNKYGEVFNTYKLLDI